MAKGPVKNRFPAVAVGHNINPGDDDKWPTVEVEMRGLENEAGKQFWLYLSLHEKCQEITAQTLRNLGWKCNDITKLEGLGSTRVDILEYEQKYTNKFGKEKTRPDYQVWPARGPRASLREEDQNNFAQRFKSLAATVKPLEVSEHNAAPTALPDVRTKNGQGGKSTGDTDADPSSMYQ